MSPEEIEATRPRFEAFQIKRGRSPIVLSVRSVQGDYFNETIQRDWKLWTEALRGVSLSPSEDSARLDWLERAGAHLQPQMRSNGNRLPGWYCEILWEVFHDAPTAREAIDAVRKDFPNPKT